MSSFAMIFIRVQSAEFNLLGGASKLCKIPSIR